MIPETTNDYFMVEIYELFGSIRATCKKYTLEYNLHDRIRSIYR